MILISGVRIYLNSIDVPIYDFKLAYNFILNKNETVGQGRKGYVKQFAAVINPEEDRPFIILAPSDFHKDESKKSNPLQGAITIDRGSWLEENGFGIREYAYEDIFREFYSTHYQTKFNIFSRVIRKSVDVTLRSIITYRTKIVFFLKRRYRNRKPVADNPRR